MYMQKCNMTLKFVINYNSKDSLMLSAIWIPSSIPASKCILSKEHKIKSSKNPVKKYYFWIMNWNRLVWNCGFVLHICSVQKNYLSFDWLHTAHSAYWHSTHSAQSSGTLLVYCSSFLMFCIHKFTLRMTNCDAYNANRCIYCASKWFKITIKISEVCRELSITNEFISNWKKRNNNNNRKNRRNCNCIKHIDSHSNDIFTWKEPLTGKGVAISHFMLL